MNNIEIGWNDPKEWDNLKVVYVDNINAMTASIGYVQELKKYREKRNRPKNKLYYPLKLSEETGEVAEVAVALEGSKRKIKKLGGAPLLKTRLADELADVFNLVMLIAEQHNLAPADVIKSATSKLYKKRNRSG